MIYVTYKGIEATVRSMQAIGQITEEVANNVLRYCATASVTGQSWDFVRDYVLNLECGALIVEQIEQDAEVNNTPIQRI